MIDFHAKPQAYRVELDKMEKIFGVDWESVHINAKRYFGLIKGRL